jgi:uracil DNA glycosylase
MDIKDVKKCLVKQDFYHDPIQAHGLIQMVKKEVIWSTSLLDVSNLTKTHFVCLLLFQILVHI